MLGLQILANGDENIAEMSRGRFLTDGHVVVQAFGVHPEELELNAALIAM